MDNPYKKTKFSIKKGKHSILKNDDFLYNVIVDHRENFLAEKSNLVFLLHLIVYFGLCQL